MKFLISTFSVVFLVSFCGCGVDSISTHQCTSDHQCPHGYFCYEESHYCTPCVECIEYNRKSSWRICPKTPSDCGACLFGHEEEILHEGKTRDICIPYSPSTLSHTTEPGVSLDRYFWAAIVTLLILPVVFYAFCRKTWRNGQGSLHHSLPHEQPPPYRSIELTTLTNNSYDEMLSEEDVVMRVGQQKDSLVQAVPFRQPDYVESQILNCDNIQEPTIETFESSDRSIVSATHVELHDENTMPSDWRPVENTSNRQLSEYLNTFELPEPQVSSDSENICEPASKRHKAQNACEEESCNTQLNINLFINNNVTIHKPS